MHHCASLAQSDDGEEERGYWLAFYIGQECTDQQRVVIQYHNDRGMVHEAFLGPGTGNPVVLKAGGFEYVIFSRFTDRDADGQLVVETTLSPVERWKYCRNFIAKLVVTRDKIELVGEREIEGTYGMLTRQSPIRLPPEMAKAWGVSHLIGMYREKDPICSLWGFNPKAGKHKEPMTHISDFCLVEEDFDRARWFYGPLGKGVAIQPALMVDRNRLFAFCRNVARVRGNDCRAWMTVTSTGTKWTAPVQSIIPSHNNSVAICQYAGRPWVVCSTSEMRDDLWLIDTKTRVKIDLRVPLEHKRHSYSYPNMLVDDGGRLHVVHTSCQRIAWHRFDETYLLNVVGRAQLAQPSLFRSLSKRRYGHILRGLAAGNILDPDPAKSIVSSDF
jgi:hypothetical protein